MKRVEQLVISALLGLATWSASAQTDTVTLTINPTYSSMNAGTAIPMDFSGLGFETASVPAGLHGFGSGVYFFSPSTTGSVTLFQNLSIHNLRIGGSSVDGCGRITPSSTDLANLFGFAAAANLKVIYSFPLLNPASCFSSTLASDSGTTANTIMTTYAANLHSFAMGNEVDFHSYHSYCTSGSTNCNCPYPTGCAVSGSGTKTTNDVKIFETYNPCTSTPCQSGAAYQPGSAFSSYLSDWLNFQSIIAGAVMSGTPLFSGPDAGDYSGSTRFTGSVTPCSSHTFTNATWTQMLPTCEGVLGATNFSLPTQHLYVGGGFGSNKPPFSNQLTADDAMNNMLSAAWVTETTRNYEPYGVGSSCQVANPSSSLGCPSYYSPYPYLNAQLPTGTRLTESNDFLGGVPGGSNAFASALWALDYMQWWAQNGAAGVNFHNNQWIYTDTIVPSNVSYGAPGSCGSDPCSTDFKVNPKGYGIKAFDLGGHGYPIPVSASPTTYNGHIDAYAVGNGQDLYVTIINKFNSVAGNAATADVTINLTPGSGNALPFASASVSSMALTDVTGGGAGNVATADWTSTTLGGKNITDTVPWYGLWNNGMASYTGGSYTVSIPAGTASVIRFHASSNYVGPIQVNQNGALEMSAIDGSGTVHHNWQKTAFEPASTPTDWNASGSAPWGSLSGVTATGSPAEIKNQNNTLEVFVPTTGNVQHIWQLTPGGTWSTWTDMGSCGCGGNLTNIQVGQNADGGLTVFGLFGGQVYFSTQNAPGVGWSSWAPLGSSVTGGIQAGYVVAQNLNGRLEVFGADGSSNPQIWHIWQTAGGTFGSAWGVLNPGAANVSNPQLAVARNLNGDLELFGIGTDGYLWHAAQTSPSGSWSTWVDLETGANKIIQPGFAVGQNDSGDLVVFGVSGTGSSASVFYNAQSSPGGAYASSWTAMGMSAGEYPTNSSLVVSNTADGRMQIFCIGNTGSSNDVLTNWQTAAGGSNSWNGWADFGSGSSGLTF